MCAAFRVLAQNHEKQRLEWANLRYLMQACQVLHLRDVFVPALFGPIAGLWSAPADVRQEIHVVVKKAALHCGLSETDRLRCYLKVLSAACPEFTAGDWEDINEACQEMLTCAKHSFSSRLILMLQLLNEPITGQSQPPLSRLAAHAFRYSYCHCEEKHHSSDRPYPARSVLRDDSHLWEWDAEAQISIIFL
ncbi:uncharacterized protein LOC129601452 [Paramacrobiotus metropolitanus]|uniref:uncharacterized protein LOC129601452 n=1 Tax=Paramacrobiotus metropolitanus TaxID=2943436 RepID=UPI002445FEAA|nr:uncharacterized protein LOC129601452 [Paramacrobiotus metropolitanus]